jgi:4'-phosphopantetheinyl transferase
MPLEKTVNEGTWGWALWKITEDETELQLISQFDEPVPTTITNSQKRLEWIAGRILTRNLLAKFGVPYTGMIKDEYGKPFLKDSMWQISLSHSFPFVAVILHREKPVGIDLEQPKDKLLRVAPRVLSPSEREDAGTDVTKHCIYWCAKETLIKIYGKKDLILAENLIISPFSQAMEGHIIGRIIVSDNERLIPLYYQVFPGFVLVFNRE